jgi:hypothetical protein
MEPGRSYQAGALKARSQTIRAASKLLQAVPDPLAFMSHM